MKLRDLQRRSSVRKLPMSLAKRNGSEARAKRNQRALPALRIDRRLAVPCHASAAARRDRRREWVLPSTATTPSAAEARDVLQWVPDIHFAEAEVGLHLLFAKSHFHGVQEAALPVHIGEILLVYEPD